ncbi:hypothetical protein L210DRAFT_2434495 [Boletus edulis BED1]|uniref:Alpha-type protein kinase domain-containing protein n=1 Tax=Boletus edulis BED1 TaxID=1328754 RepID=A0AAD4BPJ6_BOLED|nr:hypothetical protein L210DRAFT_2434495 [Boletus edulis BED1]
MQLIVPTVRRPLDPSQELWRRLILLRKSLMVVQYNKTGGLVYVSDYQGSMTLLTDPQILTHLDVGDGLSLFGDGNVEKGVELFEEQHSCSTNKYCGWPGFNMAEFGSEGESDL